MSRHALTGSALLLFSFFGLSAQTNTSSLNVNIVDQVGGAIEKAEVLLLRTGDKDRFAVSDQGGSARFQRLPPGEYQLVVRAQGFTEYRVRGPVSTMS